MMLLDESLFRGACREITLESRTDLLDYVNHHKEPSQFLKFVLSNKLFDAVTEANYENSKTLIIIVNWLCNEAPPSCYGSEEKMNDWISAQHMK